MTSRREFVRSLGGVTGIAITSGALIPNAAAGKTTSEPESIDLEIYPESEAHPVATETDAEVELTAEQFGFIPSTIRVTEGARIKIKISSSDVTHGFYLDGYGIETKVYPDEPMIVEFNAVRTGSFRVRCSVTCGSFHPFMIGRLVVSPNQRFGASLALTALAGGGVLGGVWWRARPSSTKPRGSVDESGGDTE